MDAMYAKLFARIAQSSLMEEDVEVRYCFMMLLAIADASGDVIGTDVAIARTVNLPLETFRRCIAALMEPDPDSNSPHHDGRRVVSSDAGRGYCLVNYTTYRAIKTDEEKKAYMREYMRKRRKSQAESDVTSGKTPLSDVTHAEEEADTEADAEAPIQEGVSTNVNNCTESSTTVPTPKPPKPNGNLPSTPHALRIADLFNRRHTTVWSDSEIRSFKRIGPFVDEDFALVEQYYQHERAKGDEGRHRRDLGTFLNHYAGEIDRARAWQAQQKPANGSPSRPDEPGWAEWLKRVGKAYAPQFGKYTHDLLRDQFRKTQQQPKQ